MLLNFAGRKKEMPVILLSSISGFLLLYLPNFNGAWEDFRDELYYIACAQHPDFGYVDQPPFAPLFLAVIQFLFGNSLFVIRLFPALAFGACIFLAGRIAKKLGGTLFAQVTAASCVFGSALLQVICGFYSMNSFEA